MSTVVSVRLPWGRYHATPWGRSVNEAAVEWPPSPWRFLRALYAVWQYRAADLPDQLVTRTLAQLAGAPEFHLPPYGEAHTRHYLPDTSSGTDKVFDPFVVTQRDAELLIRWPNDLAEDERAALCRLCALLSYLGRAESICAAEVRTPDALFPSDGWLHPGDLGDLANPARRVLVPREPLDVHALTITTGAARKAGLLSPAGSRWVPYPTPPSYHASTSMPDKRCPPVRNINAALLILDAPVLPSVRDTVWVGHIARQTALRCHVSPSPTLSGKDPQNGRLEGHRHAHYLPFDLDGDRMLDAVVVWAPAGLTDAELAALGKIRKLYSRQPGFRSVRVSLSAVGSLEDVLGPVPEGTTWVSATPFIPYRHRKRETMEDFLISELRRDATTRELPSVSSVEVLPGAWLDYRRSRPGEKHREPLGIGIRICFCEPTTGPITLGALSHFGMGRFRLDDDA